MAVQLAYHGTKSPISQIQSQGFRTGNLKSIAPGQVFMSNNPAFSAGYGNTIKMAAPKSTFSLPSKNLATGAWGKELITSPKAATKMMNLANYAEGLVGSPTAKRFLGGQTISGLGKKAVNTLAPKLLGGLGFLFDATPANADEINMTAEDFQNLALQNQTQPIDPTGRNLFTQYGYEDDPYVGIKGQTAFLGLPELYTLGKGIFGGSSGIKIMKEILKNKARKKIIKEGKKHGPKIIEKLTTKKTPITTAKGPPSILSRPKTKPTKPTGKDIHGGGGGGGGGQRGSTRSGFTDPGKGSYGPWKADGGLINFYRYGGFI